MAFEHVPNADPHLVGANVYFVDEADRVVLLVEGMLAGAAALRVIEDVRAFDWIALDDEALTVEVRADVLDADAGVVRAQLMNGETLAASADFRFEAQWRLPAVGPLASTRAFP